MNGFGLDALHMATVVRLEYLMTNPIGLYCL
jgi:hypothetical protein